jgi:hypothetical protein
VTGGDTLSDLVDAHGLGRVVAPACLDEVAQGLIDLLESPLDRARFQPVAEALRWSRVVAPLARYVEAPWRNGERAARSPAPARTVTPGSQLPRKAAATLFRHGPIQLLREIKSYLIWRWEQS